MPFIRRKAVKFSDRVQQRPLRVATMLLAAVLQQSVGHAAAPAPAYPTKPIRLVIPFPPGGGNDLLGRALAEKLSERLGQPIVADNRGGASSVIAAEIVSRAPADGYTLLLGTNTTLAVMPSLRSKLPYDPIKDFDPVSLLSASPYLLVVHPGVAAKTVKELIALTKSKPGQLNYSSPGHGTSNHLAMELFKMMSGADLTHVPYKGTAAAIIDLLGGRVSVMFVSTAAVRPMVNAGKLRALGISTAKRSAAMPEVAPVSESGVPGFDTASWAGVIVPRGTPAPIIARLNSEIVNVIGQGDLRERLAAQGFVPEASTPQEFAAHIRSELARFRKLVQAAGIPVE
jgi:tripartite-type tricarboxylate transporter receptor subunit TctC